MYFMNIRIGSAYNEDKKHGSACGAWAIATEFPPNPTKEVSKPFAMNCPSVDPYRNELLALVMALKLAKQQKDKMGNDPTFIITIMTSSLDLARTMTDSRAILEPANVGNIDLIRDAVVLENSLTGKGLGPEKARVQYVCVHKDEVDDVQWLAQQAVDLFW